MAKREHFFQGRSPALLGFFVACAILVSAGSTRAEERFAVIIGANAGWADDRPLRYAESDAERVEQVLVELGGFAPDRVTVLRDPDTARVRSQLRGLRDTMRRVRSETLLVFYYSGHADAEFLHLRGDPLARTELLELLRGVESTMTVAIEDACRSGAFTQKGGRPAAEFHVNLVDTPTRRGLAILSSSDADELSQESKALAGSVYTHHLVSGLRGAADDDQNGSVSLAEIYRYTFERTSADTALTVSPQKPSFRYDFRGHGELLLTTGLQGHARLVLPRSKATRYVVLDERGTRLVAEAWSKPSDEVSIVIPPGRHYVHRFYDRFLVTAQLEIEAGSSVSAEGLAYKPKPLSEGMLKGPPGNLASEEFRDWRRSEGYRLLDSNEPRAALDLFNEILLSDPTDLLALRGRARALLRLATLHEQLGNKDQERIALEAALEAEPTLAEDPQFTTRYRRLSALQESRAKEEHLRTEAQRLIEESPRSVRSFGIGFDLVSTRGGAVIVFNLLLDRIWFPYASVDIAGGFGLGFRVVPLSNRWSPYLGLGGHLSLGTLGLRKGGGSILKINGDERSYEEYFGKTLHADAGVQYMASTGFVFEAGLGAMMYDSREGGPAVAPMLNLGVGWYF